jgi:hypothetical protein
MEELDERTFLCAIELHAHGDLLARVAGDGVNLASEHGRLKGVAPYLLKKVDSYVMFYSLDHS